MKDTDRKTRWNFIFIGLALQIFALIFAFLCLTFIPYIGWLPAFYVSPFIFIAGIIFLFCSRIRIIYRFILGFWIVLVPISITGEHYYQRHFIQNEIHLIPQNYRGFVTLNFSEAGGSPAGKEDEAIVLKIESDGTLKTTYVEKRLREDFYGEDFREYFSIDESGNRTKLKVIRRFPEVSSSNDEISVMPEGSQFSLDGSTITKREFFVGTQADFPKYFKLRYPDSKITN